MTPILLLLAQAAAAAGPPAPPRPVDPIAARFNTCAALVKTDAAAAAVQAETWQRAGGGLPARLCLGLAYVAQEHWSPAEIAFSQAATEAEIQRDGRAAELWVQAANAALAGNDPAKARGDFDRALALPVLGDAMRGEAFLDRARASVVLNDLGAARHDLDQAVALVPADPLGWLLSAALARRMGDAARAAKDIIAAQKLDPNAPEIGQEAARIAAMTAPHTTP